MTAVSFALGGYRNMTTTHGGDSAALFHSYDIGNGRIVKQPASVKPFFDRLASGEAVQLKEHELAFLARIGVETLDVTDEVAKRNALKSYSEGITPAIINAGTTAPHYRVANPIKIIAAFKPA